jgi:hypothetical protein
MDLRIIVPGTRTRYLERTNGQGPIWDMTRDSLPVEISETFEPTLKLKQHEVIGCRVKLNAKKLFTEPSLTVFDLIGCFPCMNDFYHLPPTALQLRFYGNVSYNQKNTQKHREPCDGQFRI